MFFSVSTVFQYRSRRFDSSSTAITYLSLFQKLLMWRLFLLRRESMWAWIPIVLQPCPGIWIFKALQILVQRNIFQSKIWKRGILLETWDGLFYDCTMISGSVLVEFVLILNRIFGSPIYQYMNRIPSTGWHGQTTISIDNTSLHSPWNLNHCHRVQKLERMLSSLQATAGISIISHLLEGNAHLPLNYSCIWKSVLRFLYFFCNLFLNHE